MHTSVFLYTARVSVGKQKAQEFFHFMLVFKQRDGFSQQDAAVDAHLAFEVAVVQLQWVDEPFEAPDETCSCWIVFSCRFYGNFSQHIYTVYTHRIFIYIIICIITYIYTCINIIYTHTYESWIYYLVSLEAPGRLPKDLQKWMASMIACCCRSWMNMKRCFGSLIEICQHLRLPAFVGVCGKSSFIRVRRLDA